METFTVMNIKYKIVFIWIRYSKYRISLFCLVLYFLFIYQQSFLMKVLIFCCFSSAQLDYFLCLLQFLDCFHHLLHKSEKKCTHTHTHTHRMYTYFLQFCGYCRDFLSREICLVQNCIQIQIQIKGWYINCSLSVMSMELQSTLST